MLGLILAGAIGILILREAYSAIYNLYFHPLSKYKYPGPGLWIAFPVIRHIYASLGTFDARLTSLHARYGPVVRFSDDSLSFATPQAWRDIYGYGHGHTQWPKFTFQPPNADPNIIFSSDIDHTRFRRTLSHAFSEKALTMQEGIIKTYIDMLIIGLREEADAGHAVDITMWYNLTTFDIISDLAFGEPTNCLKTKQYGDFITTIFKFIRIVPVLILARQFPTIFRLFGLFAGPKLAETRTKMIGRCQEVARRRKEEKKAGSTDRGDFLESMLRTDENGVELVSEPELASNVNILFMAGSETTATSLAGVTFYLLQNPECLRKVTEEVRAAFDHDEDITFSSASSKLPYMLACLEEGLRMYPAVPTILLRRTPGPEVADVSGYEVPPQTYVGVHQLSTNTSERHFHEPHRFAPERWLPSAVEDEKSPWYNDKRDARQPFSVGPRNCIGKNLAFSEMRQILARVLWNFDMSISDGQETWANQKVFALWHKGALLVKLRSRS